jgi:hypothetical protein
MSVQHILQLGASFELSLIRNYTLKDRTYAMFLTLSRPSPNEPKCVATLQEG